MYVPKHFAEERIDVLHAAIARTGLATLVTLASDGLTATHLPLLLDPLAGSGAARSMGTWRAATRNGATSILR